MNSYYQKHNRKVSLAALKGLVVKWKDRAKSLKDADVFDESTTHTNPILRPDSQKIYEAAHEHIKARRYKWRLTVTSVFDNPDINMPDTIAGTFDAWCSFLEIASVCVNIHNENLEEGGEDFYLYTEFKAECLEVPKIPYAKKKRRRK